MRLEATSQLAWSGNGILRNDAPCLRSIRSCHSPLQQKNRAAMPYTTVHSSGYPGYAPVGGDASIKVIGVGGGGGNALNRMIASGLQARAMGCQCMHVS